MKNLIKVLSFILILSIICVPFVACNKTSSDSNDDVITESVSYKIVYYDSGKINYISLGSYPQEKASDVSVEDIKTGDFDEDTGYYSYNGNKYSIIEATPNSNSYYFSDGTLCVEGNEYAFLVSEIKWNIIYSKEDAAYFVQSRYILDAVEYQLTENMKNNYYYDAENNIIYNGGEHFVYVNDYTYSNLKNFSESFYSIAYTSAEKKDIYLTEVDNTTSNGSNGTYTSLQKNTNEYVYIMSYNELTNSKFGYTSEDSADTTKRKIQATDYAIAKGLFVTVTNDVYYGRYWTRSPGTSENQVYVVKSVGQITQTSNLDKLNGYVPNMKIVRL